MKVAILAGGLGTRLSEETELIPKPMISIGGKPILWHIMKIYSHYGFNEFIICLGYRGYVIKEYFGNYFLHMSDVTFDIGGNKLVVHENNVEPWKVTLIDTGLKTMTGGRIKRIQKYVGDESFFLTYGDGLADVNIHELLEFHQNHGKIASVTSTQPTARFGAINVDEHNRAISFTEKPAGDGAWINGGFFVFEPEIFNYLTDDTTVLEGAPLEKLATDCELMAKRHTGFWHPMDTLRDKKYLEELWEGGNAPWKLWSEARSHEVQSAVKGS